METTQKNFAMAYAISVPTQAHQLTQIPASAHAANDTRSVLRRVIARLVLHIEKISLDRNGPGERENTRGGTEFVSMGLCLFGEAANCAIDKHVSLCANRLDLVVFNAQQASI
jgi:hypothetical protein